MLVTVPAEGACIMMVPCELVHHSELLCEPCCHLAVTAGDWNHYPAIEFTTATTMKLYLNPTRVACDVSRTAGGRTPVAGTLPSRIRGWIGPTGIRWWPLTPTIEGDKSTRGPKPLAGRIGIRRESR